MVVMNFTIDDRSPLIRYDPPGDWILGARLLDDSDAGRYSNGGTFTLTTNASASASFDFNGTAIWIFGAKRFNHDGAVQTFDGLAIPPEFQVPLFAASQLQPGPHSVTITNRRTEDNKPFLDIDFITWTSEVAGPTTTPDQVDIIQQTIVPQTSPQFDFRPSSAWLLKLSLGDSVMVFGSVDPGAGEYTVQMDGGSPQAFNATVAEYVPQTPLYFTDNLGPGIHILKLVNSPAVAGRSLTIDYASVGKAVAVARTAIPTSIAATSAPRDPSQATSSPDNPPSNGLPLTAVPPFAPTQRSELAGETKQLSTGNIAALVISVVASVFVVSLLLIIWRRRQERGKMHWKVSSGSAIEDGVSNASEFARPYNYITGSEATPTRNADSKRGATPTMGTHPSVSRITSNTVDPALPPNPPSYDELLSAGS
ncbi:hypothetical protein ONZ45_g4257 [Pleurotus djamor]|nr:hypothetical protein ONZ45_g4257 [Pleurotus djamor]